MPHYLRRARRNSPIWIGDIKVDTTEELKALIEEGLLDPEMVKAAAARVRQEEEEEEAVEAPRRRRGRSARQAAAAREGREGRRMRAGRGSRGSQRQKSTRRRGGGIKNRNAPITFGQAKKISNALGGIKKYCPAFAGKQVKDSEGEWRHISNVEIMELMGITMGVASDVIDAMISEEVLGWNQDSPEEAETARNIFEDITGVSCPWEPAQ
jgi:hypothetical protein